jgi:ATP-dependent Zn protease
MTSILSFFTGVGGSYLKYIFDLIKIKSQNKQEIALMRLNIEANKYAKNIDYHIEKEKCSISASKQRKDLVSQSLDNQLSIVKNSNRIVSDILSFFRPFLTIFIFSLIFLIIDKFRLYINHNEIMSIITMLLDAGSCSIGYWFGSFCQKNS